MRRIRVLRVIGRMNVGGPALQVSALTRGLDPEVFEQRLLIGAVERGEADYVELRAPGLPAQLIPGLGRSPKPLADFSALATVLRVMREFQPDIVHTHTAKAGFIGRTAAILAWAPIVAHTFHGHLLHGYFSQPLTRAVIGAERVMARRSACLMAVGERVRDELLAAGIGRPEQYRVVPPGTELGPLPEPLAARRMLGLNGHGPVVAFIGRLTAIKRPERFVDVALSVGHSHPTARFVLAGNGPLLDSLRARAAPLGERMRFLGWRSDVETVYAAADVVVLTSDNEGMPVSLIEASMAGRPCVSTDVGSAAEVIDHERTGLVTESSLPAIVGAVDRLLRDEDVRRRMGEAAAKRAVERFSRSRLVGDIDAIYRELTDRYAGRLAGAP